MAIIASALESSGRLERLVTSWCFTESEWYWAKKLPLPECWLRRSLAPVPPARLVRLPGADVRKHLGQWLTGDRFKGLDGRFQFVDRMAASLVRAETSAILGREDACLESFRRGEEFDIPRVYQLPTAHYATVKQLLQREQDLVPEAFNAAELDVDFAEERVQRKAAELSSATHLLCHSSFVRQSLKAAGIEDDRISMIPLGIDTSLAPDRAVPRHPVFLYAGSISARKGVHRLLKIWKQMRAYRTHQLRLIGDLHLPRRFVDDFKGVFEHVPRLPRKSLVWHYATAQAFLFNSLADGFGHVCAEAMTCGTPVIASRNSAAPDLMRDGEEGWLYNYGDDEALGAALGRALGSPQKLRQMGEGARYRAQQWTCEHFAAAFLTWLNGIVEGRIACPTAPRAASC